MRRDVDVDEDEDEDVKLPALYAFLSVCSFPAQKSSVKPSLFSIDVFSSTFLSGHLINTHIGL